MLTAVHIQNFRSCENVRIDDLGPVVALVGRNGAGKSNMLQAILQAARTASATDSSVLRELLSPDRPFAVDLSFRLGNIEYDYSISVALTTDSRQIRPVMREMLSSSERGHPKRPLVQRDGGVVTLGGRIEPLPLGDLSPSLPSLTTLLPANDEIVLAIRPVLTFLSAIRYYPLDEPGDVAAPVGVPVSEGEYAAWVARYEASGNAGSSVYLPLVHMSLKRKDDFAVLKSLLGQAGLGLIDEIIVSPVNAGRSGSAQDNLFYFIRFIPSRGRAVARVVVGADGLSLGTRRVLRMLVSMIFDLSSVMLLEQPEDSLHQGLTKSLIGLLRQNAGSAQLIMSSHSSVLLNRLRPEEIRLVSLHNGFTAARQLTPEELEIAADFMNQQGPLYDFLETVQED